MMQIVIEAPQWVVERFQEDGVAPASWSQQAVAEAIRAALHGQELRQRRTPPTSYAVQRFVLGAWEDAGDYPDTESTTVRHARERTKYDGVPHRAVIRLGDGKVQVIATYKATGHPGAYKVQGVQADEIR